MTGLMQIGEVTVCIVCCPLAGIWALNTLFGLSIDITFKTWAAMLTVMGLLDLSTGTSRK